MMSKAVANAEDVNDRKLVYQRSLNMEKNIYIKYKATLAVHNNFLVH